MDSERTIVKGLKRFRQKTAECAIASSATLISFVDKSVDYEQVSDLISHSEKKNGLETSQQCTLLNMLGNKSITVVSADQDLVDFSWSKLSKKGLIRKLKAKRAYYGHARDRDCYNVVNRLVKWLEDKDCDNNIIIDNDWRKYITNAIKNGRPVGAAFNWNNLHKFSKGTRGDRGDIVGDRQLHAVVIRGCDSKGVFVIDSHWQSYFPVGRMAHCRNGYYKLPWDDVLINTIDLILI